MKTLLSILFFSLLSIPLFAQDTLRTNVRLASEQNMQEENPAVDLMSYEITVNDGKVKFICDECIWDFIVDLTDTLETTSDGDYYLVTMDTPESDYVTLFYNLGKLEMVVIHQINGVDLFYRKSKITVEDQTFRS